MTAPKKPVPDEPTSNEEKAKFQAEAAKARAEADGAKWDALIKKADATVAVELAAAGLAEQLAIVRGAEAAALEQEIGARALERREAEYLHHDRFHHIYNFEYEVGSKSVRACMEALTTWSREAPKCPIEIIFTSPGGSVTAGFALWDFLRALQSKGHHITTVAYGYAASMAAILLQVGDTRIMGSESWMLIHEVSSWADGKIGEMEDTMEWLKKMSSRVVDIFAARSNLTRKQIEAKWTRRDWWLDSEEALRLGLIDSIR